MTRFRFSFFVVATIALFSCQDKSTQKLPYLGNPKMVDGKEVQHTIRPFQYLTQDSTILTNDSLKNYIYVTDFFFTSCPSICPRVAKQMLRIHDAFKEVPTVKLVSFTIDPKRDTPSKLRKYAGNLEVSAPKWYFLTGDKEATFELAYDYFVTAKDDATAPGGFDHSGSIILIDKSGHVRAFCEGTDPATIPAFIDNIHLLLKEYEKH